VKTKFCSLFIVHCSLSCLLFGVFSQALAQEEFIYDSMGRRDPLIPLLDQKSPTGLRAGFSPPRKRVRLPMELKIKGILWNGREYFAIINEKVMKKGEALGEVKIKEIEQDRVIVEYTQREFTVFLREEKEK